MRLLKRSPLLSAALAVAVLSMGAVAADAAAASTTGLPNLSDTSSATDSTSATDSSSAAAKTSATTDSNTDTTTSSSASKTTATITGDSTTGTDSTTASIPSITGSGSTDTGGALTGLPTLTGAYVIVAPSVPPTSNAPYMQTSKLPEGTVFIAVGAVLGFLGMSVLLWRGLVAWSLHRSVKRAALAQHAAMADTKPLFRNTGAPGPPPAPFYKYTDRESTISLSGLGGHKRKSTYRPPTASNIGSTSNLFFSPTAGAAVAGLANPGNRGSSYLPAGYYAAGAAAAGNGQSHMSMGGHGPAISLSNLGPQAQGYPRAMSVASGPDSPQFMASNRGHMASSSTLNLTTGYGNGPERAPSAYLDDLFDGENAPPVPGQHMRGNSNSPHRF